jgi:hypothetical protein
MTTYSYRHTDTRTHSHRQYTIALYVCLEVTKHTHSARNLLLFRFGNNAFILFSLDRTSHSTLNSVFFFPPFSYVYLVCNLVASGVCVGKMLNQRSQSFSSATHVLSMGGEFDFERKKTLSDHNHVQSIHVKVLAQKKKFWWFALIASLNHALSYVVTSYATSLLSSQLAGIILGLTWSLNSVSGLVVATPTVRRLGFKTSMIISLWGYTIQIATLYWAVKSPDVTVAWVVAIVGNVIAGITSAIWWTAQGVYFEHVCGSIDELLTDWRLEDPATSIATIRADLSAHWTIVYQSADIVVFLSLSIFPILNVISIDGVVFALVVLGVLTSLMGHSFETVSISEADLNTHIWESIVAVPKQYRDDCRVSLLAPFVFGFGITTAMFAFYVNSSTISDSSNLGTVTLGFLEAFSYFIAVISAYPYAYIARTFKRGQDWVVQFGSLSFLLCGLLLLTMTNNELATWQFILLSKCLYGLGRGVFEGSCRAVYAEAFKGGDLSTAFSGQTLSAGLSGGICFFIFGYFSRYAIGSITVVNGLVAISCYFVFMYGIDSSVPTKWSALCTATKITENASSSTHHSSIKSPLLTSDQRVDSN